MNIKLQPMITVILTIQILFNGFILFGHQYHEDTLKTSKSGFSQSSVQHCNEHNCHSHPIQSKKESNQSCFHYCSCINHFEFIISDLSIKNPFNPLYTLELDHSIYQFNFVLRVDRPPRIS